MDLSSSQPMNVRYLSLVMPSSTMTSVASTGTVHVRSGYISVAAQLLSNIKNHPQKIILILLHIILIIQYYID